MATYFNNGKLNIHSHRQHYYNNNNSNTRAKQNTKNTSKKLCTKLNTCTYNNVHAYI